MQVLDERGRVTEPALLAETGLGDDALLELYRDMVVARRVDEEAIALQRQGQLGVYASLRGQEAAQVGSAHALEAHEWIFPSYRELAAAIVRGVPPSGLLEVWRGTWFAAHDPYTYRFALYAIPIATQCLHAVGFAMGASLSETTDAVLCYLGDGATSEGDSHEAFNFAAVRQAPVVFFVQNNNYAISLSFDRQSGSSTVAQKAVAYGMPGVRCDGNDVLASYLASKRALDRARAGGGPSLIEAVTYRLESHTTADDAGRYRDEDEVQRWRSRDPISRFERFLERETLLSEDIRQDVRAAADGVATTVRNELYDAPAPPPSELFEHVYVDVPPALEHQRHQLLAEVQMADDRPEGPQR